MDEIFIAYTGLLSLATITIYTGAWGSLPPPPRVKTSKALEEDEDDERDLDERLSSSDAYVFPIIASAALFGLYLIFKYLGPRWINWLFGWYFALMGIGSVWKTSVALLRTIVGRQTWKSFHQVRIVLYKSNREIFSQSFRTPIPFLLPFACLPSILYVIPSENKSALLTNILSLSFGYNALCLLKLDSFQTGTILLVGLFLYDIWWVFGTEVMVSVAKTLDAPIKILWPKASNFSSSKGYALLGLGDIVIPGAFITLALRRDLFASGHKNFYGTFAKPYFTASLLAYVVGLIITIVIMHTWGAAQPALLYLSPACILSFLFTATRRGELRDVWTWKDESQSENENPTNGTKVLEPIEEVRVDRETGQASSTNHDITQRVQRRSQEKEDC